MSEKWKYFVSDNNFWGFSIVLWATNEEKGYLFRKGGTSKGGTSYESSACYSMPAFSHWLYKLKETSLENALTFIDKKGRDNVLRCLGVSLEPIVLSGPQLDKIISFLVNEKAFNGDCAYKADDKQWGYLKRLEDLDIVKVSCLDNEMFYLVDDYKQKVEKFKEEKNETK